MQTIPETYKQAGHVMQLQKREDMAVIYKAIGYDYWEVHRIRIAPADTIRGYSYPEREILAGNEAFGDFGWACVSQNLAEARFVGAKALNALSEQEA